MKTQESKIHCRWSAAALGVLAPLIAASLFTAVSVTPAQADDNRAPDVPANLVVPDGNKVHFYAYAIGVQIYAWDGSKWVFQRPEAVLFASAEDEGVVGQHFLNDDLGLPEWQSNGGSFVVGRRFAAATPDPTAIPWLLLQAAVTGGPGVLAPTTYVQRINTVGGIAPANPGTTVGQTASVPYAAQYVFYREE